jgi:excisionase family DNA binding protein
MATVRQHASNTRKPDQLPKTGLITVQEAAGYLAMSACKIYEMSNLGTIPSVKIGKSRRFKLTDLENFVASL